MPAKRFGVMYIALIPPLFQEALDNPEHDVAEEEMVS